MSSSVTLKDIVQAQELLKGVIHKTLLDKSHTFSEMTGAEGVYLKLENLQKTGSFKIRGAYHKIRSLTDKERRCGVIAASAGNHAQGVAYGARAAGIKATIVMPEQAPLAKVMATRSYGAEVVLAGSVYDESFQKALELQKVSGQVFVHAFNDEAVIAGQGTIGLEIVDDLPDIGAIVVPVGGGGLIAGIAAAVKARAPHVKVIGVQAKGASAMYLSKQAHELKGTASAVTIADGIAVKTPGDLSFSIIDKYVDDIVVVDDESIAAAILMLLERSKLMVEGAGAVSLAALLQGLTPVKGKVAAVISGGNVDVNFISRIIERGLVKAGRRVKLSTYILDRPGELQRLLAVVAELQANVINIYHDRLEQNVPIGESVVELRLETRDALHTDAIVGSLRKKGYSVYLV